MPGDIVVGPNGSVYVTDSPNHIVKVYAADGTFQFSFGSYGSGIGQMIFPTGIAWDAANQEIYVVDHNNGRVQVFNPSGTFLRAFGRLGAGQGRLSRPHGIFISGGNVYVTDAFQSSIQVFDGIGTFITFISQYGEAPGSLRIPMDVLLAGGKLYVANSDNGRIEVFDLLDRNALVITPLSLSFTAEVGTVPPAQEIQVTSEVVGAAASWTAAGAAPFIVSPAAGTTGTTPAIAVSVDTTRLQAGAYTGAIVIAAQNNVTYTVPVTLTVTQPTVLYVSPSSMSIVHQKGSAFTATAVSVMSEGGTLNWTATIESPLFAISLSSGSTPGSVGLILADPAGISEGIYSASLTVSASGATIAVPVSVQVVVAGTIEVKTNIEAASFTITGRPCQCAGEGGGCRG